MSQNNTANEAKGFYKLSWLQRIGFGSGDMAQNLIYQTVSIWLLFFYTNVFGLSPGAAALMFLRIIVSLLAQGHSPEFSAKSGVYLHGAAADKVAEKRSMHALIPSDIIEEL